MQVPQRARGAVAVVGDRGAHRHDRVVAVKLGAAQGGQGGSERAQDFPGPRPRSRQRSRPLQPPRAGRPGRPGRQFPQPPGGANRLQCSYSKHTCQTQYVQHVRIVFFTGDAGRRHCAAVLPARVRQVTLCITQAGPGIARRHEKSRPAESGTAELNLMPPPPPNTAAAHPRQTGAPAGLATSSCPHRSEPAAAVPHGPGTGPVGRRRSGGYGTEACLALRGTAVPLAPIRSARAHRTADSAARTVASA